MASLVYHAGALGDFITALPAMTVWRRLHPGETAVLLGKPSFAQLASPAFDEVWDAQGPGSARLSSRFTAITSALLFAAPDSPLAAQMRAHGVRDVVQQAPFPSTSIPIVDYHLSLFPASALCDEDRLPCVTLSGAALPGAAGAVVIHPGSGSPRKNWPLERFVELARLLEADGRKVRWIAGPAEEGLAVPPSVSLWREHSLVTLAATLASCALYVGNDSGVTHLAASCGCATIALFDAARPAVWAPRGRNVTVISSDTERMEISLIDVLKMCRQRLRS
jgi:heptosyltransferase III